MTRLLLLCGALMVVAAATEALKIFAASSSTKAHYGETCNKTNICDRRARLSCIEGTCTCRRPDEMTFEISTQKCGIRVGEQCKFLRENEEGNVTPEYEACVSGALCAGDGYCSCEQFYTPNGDDGTCEPSKGQKFGEKCDGRLECSNSSGLACERGYCACNSYSEFSAEHKQCVGGGLLPCINSFCVLNTTCSAQNICECNRGYFLSQDENFPHLGKCSLKFQRLETCSRDQQCDDTDPNLRLTCVQNSCDCNPEVSIFGSAQGYDEDQQKFLGPSSTHCLGTEGHPCIADLCTAGAFCNSSTGTCSCLPDYSPTSSGKCAIGYGGKWRRLKCVIPAWSARTLFALVSTQILNSMPRTWVNASLKLGEDAVPA